jgi:hypothetical protein
MTGLKCSSPHHAVCVAIAIALSLAAADATAQSAPRFSVSAGGGITDLFHADFDFRAKTWTAGVRVLVSDHVGLDFGVVQWRHTEVLEGLNIQLQGPGGGHVDRLTQRTTRTQRGVGVSLLWSGGQSRVNVSAGGGAGVFTHRRDFVQTVEGCTNTPPGACLNTSNTFSSIRLGVQAMGELAVAVAKPLWPFVQVRFHVPDIGDAGSAELAVLFGARVGF